ncbi:MAG: hypothetical protein QW506_02575 [Thermoproteota archaeon]
MYLSGNGFRGSPGFKRFFKARCRVSLFLVDETAVVVKCFIVWIWVAYEPFSKRILGFWLSWIGIVSRPSYS